MPDILLTEQITGPAVDALRERFDVAAEPDLWRDPVALAEQIGDARAIMVRNQTQVTAELIEKAKDLRVIGRAGAGLDNIDVQAASNAGVVVVSAPVQNAISVAELTLGMMVTLARKLTHADRHVKGGGWERRRFMGGELYGKTLGIAGFGRIGFLVAMRARAMGMNVVAHDPFVNADSVLVSEAGVRLVSLDELLRDADFLTCHLPSTPQTRRLFDAKRFARMKPGAFFLNVARGDVVDEAALVGALREERIAGAALDVRQTEPPEVGDLEGMENVLLTPHIGAFTDEAQGRVLSAVCGDIGAVLDGEAANNYVNFPTRRSSLQRA